jgi:hypothetical protein
MMERRNNLSVFDALIVDGFLGLIRASNENGGAYDKPAKY